MAAIVIGSILFCVGLLHLPEYGSLSLIIAIPGLITAFSGVAQVSAALTVRHLQDEEISRHHQNLP